MDIPDKWNQHLRQTSQRRYHTSADDGRVAVPNSVVDTAAREPSPPPTPGPSRAPMVLPRSPRRHRHVCNEDGPTGMPKQPETRPISQEQLVAEVKGIYAGLVMVERKCLEVEEAQSLQSGLTKKLSDGQWRSLIALHRTLLYEHHDLVLASQHPSASPALQRLGAKYAMPVCMWNHNTQSSLDLFRQRPPTYLDLMLTFSYLTYAMVVFLHETLPAVRETWFKYLGDLDQCRMAIEEGRGAIRSLEVSTSDSRHRYSPASSKPPATGRLYRHLAILARPNLERQLQCLSKSPYVGRPLSSAQEKITALYDPLETQASTSPAELRHRLGTANIGSPDIDGEQMNSVFNLVTSPGGGASKDRPAHRSGPNPFPPGSELNVPTLFVRVRKSRQNINVGTEPRPGLDLDGDTGETNTAVVAATELSISTATPSVLAAEPHTLVAGPAVPTYGRRNSTIRILVRPFRNLLFGLFALTSFVMSLTAVQIKDPVTKIGLRVASSVCVVLLFVGYPLLFLHAIHPNTPDFVYGLGACAFTLCVLVRLIGPTSGTPTGEHDDSFSWLDTTNFIGLAAVVVGVLNAETHLFDGLCSQPRHGASGHDEEAIPLQSLQGSDDEEDLSPDSAVVAAPESANDRLSSLVFEGWANLLAMMGVP